MPRPGSLTPHPLVLGALLIPATVLAEPAPDPDPRPPAQASPAPASPAHPLATPSARVAAAHARVGLLVPPRLVEPLLVPPAMLSPEYEEIEDTYNAPMFVSGALVFGATYGASVITAASSNDSRGNHHLYVPVVGPWLALSDRGSCDGARSSCDHDTAAKILLVADGVFQAAGVIGMLDGLFRPTKRRVIHHTAKIVPRLHLEPSFVHGDPGVAMIGRF